jgi:Tol biopolymer transport system component
VLQRIVTALLLLTLSLTASGAAQRRMTLDDVLAIRQAADPRVSPDGSRVVYTASETDLKANEENIDLWLAPSSGGPSRRLTLQPRDDRHPRWSPEGALIAFLSDRASRDDQGEPVERRTQIWLLPVDGGEARQLTRSPTAVSDFVWSPDGKQIGYVAVALADDHEASEARRKAGFDEVMADDHRMNHLWTIDVDGGKPVQITRGDFHASEPAWSPTGDLIAFVSRPTPGANEQLLSDLYVVPASGGSPQKLVSNDGADFAPAWSPDGTAIAYLSNSRRQSSGAHNTIAILRPLRGEPRVVLHGFEYSAGAPRWSPDGRSLYSSAGTKTESHVFTVSASGGEPRSLTSGSLVASSIDLASNGRLAFLREDPRTPEEVWTANAVGTAARRITDVNPQGRDSQRRGD